MRTLTLAKFLILVAPALAQQGFYLRPQFDHKWNRCSCASESFDLGSSSLRIEPKRFFSGAALNFVLSIGYKRQNWLVDLSTSEDESLLDFRVNGFADGTGRSGYIRQHQSGITFTRTALLVMVKAADLTGVRSGSRLRSELWGVLGAQRWRRPGADRIVVNGSWSPAVGDTVTYELENSIQATSGYFVMGGFTLKVFNRRGHSIFNLSALYSASLTGEAMFSAELSFRDHATSGTRLYNIGTRGVGLYIGVSKDIYFNNIFRKKKPPTDPYTQ